MENKDVDTSILGTTQANTSTGLFAVRYVVLLLVVVVAIFVGTLLYLQKEQEVVLDSDLTQATSTDQQELLTYEEAVALREEYVKRTAPAGPDPTVRPVTYTDTGITSVPPSQHQEDLVTLTSGDNATAPPEEDRPLAPIDPESEYLAELEAQDDTPGAEAGQSDGVVRVDSFDPSMLPQLSSQERRDIGGMVYTGTSGSGDLPLSEEAPLAANTIEGPITEIGVDGTYMYVLDRATQFEYGVELESSTRFLIDGQLVPASAVQDIDVVRVQGQSPEGVGRIYAETIEVTEVGDTGTVF